MRIVNSGCIDKVNTRTELDKQDSNKAERVLWDIKKIEGYQIHALASAGSCAWQLTRDGTRLASSSWWKRPSGYSQCQEEPVFIFQKNLTEKNNNKVEHPYLKFQRPYLFSRKMTNPGQSSRIFITIINEIRL